MAIPQYPIHNYLSTHPELLYMVPERWRRNTVVLRILAGVVSLILIGEAAAAQKPNTTPSSRIAPLFQHGEGRGAFGCVAVNPPVFLSEDEALQVIRDEAKKAGLEFTPDALTIKNASVPITEPYWCPRDEEGARPPASQSALQRQNLVLSGFDEKHNVAFEFVSQKEFKAWENKNPACMSTVSVYDMKGTAESLRTGLQSETGLPWMGVFYEPAASAPDMHRLSKNATEADWKAAWDKHEKAARKIGEEELRKQVDDFIRWLKAQGVI